MKNEVNSIRKENYILRIFQDEYPDSPREDDNLGTMICFHLRYNLGDEHEYNHNHYSTWNEQKEDIIKKEDVCVILPLYLYDHGGITMSTSPFSCRWDSGQIGWIFVSKKQVRKEYGVKKITKDIIEKVTNVLEGEVKTYDQYLTGDVYGYKLSKVTKCDLGHEHEEIVDSCWGYYGQEYVMEEGTFLMESFLKNEVV